MPGGDVVAIAHTRNIAPPGHLLPPFLPLAAAECSSLPSHTAHPTHSRKMQTTPNTAHSKATLPVTRNVTGEHCVT
eukprot:3675707-Pleurochrysis_carterae.AAC.1